MTNVRRRRTYLPLALLACLFCPAHVLGFLALFGLGAGQARGLFHFGLEEVVGLVVVGAFILAIELRHHRHHRCQHE